MDALEQLPGHGPTLDRLRLLTLELEVAMAFVDVVRTTHIGLAQAGALQQVWSAYCSLCEAVGQGEACSQEDRARIQRISDALGKTLCGWIDQGCRAIRSPGARLLTDLGGELNT